MAKEDMPFDEDTMTLIMGLGGPSEPGQHGRTKAKPMPGGDPIELIMNIRDMIDDFLATADRPEPSAKPPKGGPKKPPKGEEMEEDFEEEEENEF